MPPPCAATVTPGPKLKPRCARLHPDACNTPLYTPNLSSHTGGTREDGQEDCFHQAQILERLVNHQSTTFGQCLLQWVYTANGQKGKKPRRIGSIF